MASQTHLAGTAVSSGVGNAWSNPSNATGATDGVFASEGGTGASATLLLTNFSFTIPTGATINGVEAGVLRRGDGTDIRDASVLLVKGGSAGGTDHADAVTVWLVTDVAVGYGTPTDLWGLALTDADVNASNFGLAFSCTCVSPDTGGLVDSVSITVYYTEGSDGTDFAFPSCPPPRRQARTVVSY